jgi:nucleotide-binding universal stress UspA family protein
VNPRLIVGLVDLSSRDMPELAQAAALSRWHGAALHVVCIRSGGSADTDNGTKARLDEAIARVMPGGIRMTPVVLSGDPLTTVLEYVRTTPADLLVVGQYTHRGSRYWSAGSFAGSLGRRVECPTLTVPGPFRLAPEAEGAFRNIVCAIDFSEASRRAMNQALTLAQQCGGRVTLLHVLEGFPYEAVYSGARALRLIDEYQHHVARVRQDLRALVPADALNWCEVDTEVVSGLAHEAIPATAAAQHADLIVIGAPRRPRFEQVMTGSTVKGVLRRAPSAVLIVPGPSAVSERIPEAQPAYGSEVLHRLESARPARA